MMKTDRCTIYLRELISKCEVGGAFVSSDSCVSYHCHNHPTGSTCSNVQKMFAAMLMRCASFQLRRLKSTIRPNSHPALPIGLIVRARCRNGGPASSRSACKVGVNGRADSAPNINRPDIALYSRIGLEKSLAIFKVV